MSWLLKQSGLWLSACAGLFVARTLASGKGDACAMPSYIERVGQDHTGPRLALAGAESRRAGRAAVGDEALVSRATACPRCEALGFGEAPKAEGRGAVPIGNMNDKGTHPIVVRVKVPPLLTSDNSRMALRARDYR